MFDFNCDLGEGESWEIGRALVPCVDSVNLAWRPGADKEATMRRYLELACLQKNHVGAHPGIREGSEGDRGRDPSIRVDPASFDELLRVQVDAVRECAEQLGIRLHHVKLHGALYHASDTDSRLGEQYVQRVKELWPGLIIYARAGGAVARMAASQGVEIWEEGFLDRGYQIDGTLVPRNRPGALLESIDEITGRVKSLVEHGGVWAHDGNWLPLRPRTLCVHGDTPRALEFIRSACATMERLRSHQPLKS